MRRFLLLVPLIQGIERALTTTGLPLTAEGLLIAFVSLVALRAAIVYGRDLLGRHIQLGLTDRLRRDAFGSLLAAKWSVARGKRSSDFANLLITDLARVGIGVQMLLTLFTGGAVMVAYAAAGAVDPR